MVHATAPSDGPQNGQLNTAAYQEGVRACLDGKRNSACPYRGTKKEVVDKVDWLHGYADQARKEATEAGK